MGTEQPDEPTGEMAVWLTERYFKVHSALFIAAVLIWLIANLFFPGDWSAFWPLMIWTIIYMIHFMVFRGTHIDQDWVDERVLRIADESKDFSHIENIRKDYTGRVARPPAATTPDDRAKD